MTATLTKWYEEHGRHEIFAGGKKVKMDDESPLPAAARRSGYQRTAARSGQSGHRQELRAKRRSGRGMRRRHSSQVLGLRLRQHGDGNSGRRGHRGPVKNDEAYNARMASLYREVVLKEKPAVAENGFIPLGALGKANGGMLRLRSRKLPSRWRGTSSALSLKQRAACGRPVCFVCIAVKFKNKTSVANRISSSWNSCCREYPSMSCRR